MTRPPTRPRAPRPPRLLALALCTAACGSLPEAPEGVRFARLVEREWEARLAADPILAARLGRPGAAARLPDVSPDALTERAEGERALLEELDAIDPTRLSREERVSWVMLRSELADRIADFGFGAWQVPFNSDSGFHTELAGLARGASIATREDAEAWIARLRAMPAYVDAQVANLRVGLARGMTVPRAAIEHYAVTIATHVVDDPERSVFFAPLAALPGTLPAGERERLLAEGRAAVRDGALAAFRRFLAFFEQEYLPGARTTIACADLPNGREYYEHLVRHFTTLERSPEQVHELGLAEVARIRAEMEAVLARTGFEGDFAAFLEHLRTDPRFYATTPEELLARAARIAKRADGALPAFFGRLPRRPYGVEPVPAHLAPVYTSGRYVPPASEREAGTYWVNTHALESRPLYALPALTLHEAVPGHHLQISLAAELEDLPPFRRHVYVDAFGEGWALYCEWLGIEMGIYRDPYEDFGRLTYEMWRACRLVVDTGIHAMGWSRQRAIDYLAGNTALSLHECTTEVDRYIAWPGQALAYKSGELEIRALRGEAEEALGPRFDLRAFHDALLESGAVPLPVLRARIEAWIARSRG